MVVVVLDNQVTTRVLVTCLVLTIATDLNVDTIPTINIKIRLQTLMRFAFLKH
jgi:hypothetical protein